MGQAILHHHRAPVEHHATKEALCRDTENLSDPENSGPDRFHRRLQDNKLNQGTRARATCDQGHDPESYDLRAWIHDNLGNQEEAKQDR